MNRRVIHALAAFTAQTLPAAALAQASPSDFTSAVRYDDMNRVVGTILPDPDGTGPLKYAATRTTYDADGRVITVEKGQLTSWQSESVAPSAWPVWNPATGTGFEIFSQVDTTYDALDRKLTDTLSSGGTPYQVTQYSYDVVGRLDCTAVRMNPSVFGSLPSSACTASTTGSYGPDRISKNVYDDAGQVLQVQKAYGTSLQQDYVTYTYSNNGKVLTVKDANGNKAGYTYDGLDRQTQWNFPDKVTTGTISSTDYEAYTYDANGRRLSLRKRDASVINYTYDNLNSLTVKDIPGGTSADVYYGYDARGEQLYARFASTTGAGITNTYDGFGRLASTTNDLSGTALTLSYQYDADGDRKRLTFPDGNYVNSNYEGLDRLVEIFENGGSRFIYRSYEAKGGILFQANWNVATDFGYDGLSRLSSLANDLSGTTSDVTTTFSFNPASQIISKYRSNNNYAFGGYASS
ncbi:MAG: RHS repeat protein, partial [Acidobacteria bacterium]|nr:RHS repeat protein [Acidobacteriota bacterium]